jgi:hypothetical protein
LLKYVDGCRTEQPKAHRRKQNDGGDNATGQRFDVASQPNAESDDHGRKQRQTERPNSTDKSRRVPRAVERANQPTEPRDRMQPSRRLADDAIEADSCEDDTGSHQRHG